METTIDIDFSRVRLEVLRKLRIPDRKPAKLATLLTEWGLSNQTQECVWVIATDAAGNVRTVIEVNRGGHAEVEVHIPSVMTAVLAAAATVFTMAHNHPTGNPAPSTADQDLNLRIMDAANACGLVYEEHLIVEPGGTYFSFVEAGLLVPASRGGGKLLNVKRAAAGR